jgi:hypothetical protein
MTGQGQKPRYSLTAFPRVERGAPKPDKSERVKIASGWDGNFGVNLKMQDAHNGSVGVAFIELTNGQRITPTSHWLEWKDWSEQRGATRGGGGVSRPPTSAEAAAPTDYGDDDGLPF